LKPGDKTRAREGREDHQLEVVVRNKKKVPRKGGEGRREPAAWGSPLTCTQLKESIGGRLGDALAALYWREKKG